jgi:hypothetical protein
MKSSAIPPPPPPPLLLLLLQLLLLLLGCTTAIRSSPLASLAIPDQPSEAEIVNTLEAKLRLLRDAFDGGALRLDSYLSAAELSVRDAASRRHGVSQASRRMLQATVPNAMSGKHVTVVTIEDHPFTTRTSANGGPLAYSGFCPRMLDEISRLANFTYTWVPRTPAQVNNGWAGAVNDVDSGVTDMFWSSFFLTSRRASLVDVTASFLDSGFQTVAKCNLGKDDEVDNIFEWFAKTVEAPFSPFSRNLWACTLLAMMGYAGVMYTLERPTDLKNMDEKQLAEIPAGLMGVAHGLFHELYLTVTFLTVGAGREPDTMFGKMLLSIMSFFVLVATSMYTANLATQLLLSAQENTQVSSHISIAAYTI